MAGALRVIRRGSRLAGLLLIAVFLVPMGYTVGRRRTRIVMQWWYGRLLKALDIELRVRGGMPAEAALIVSNHSTWLDIVVLGHVFDAAFISKAEVARWPVIGVYAHVSGTLFLARGAFRTNVTRRQIHDALADGRNVILFPQGTTAVSPVPERFHPRLFSAAVDHGDPVLPVALRYSDAGTRPGCHHADIPWVNEPLLSNVLHVLRIPSLRVDVDVCSLIPSGGHSRSSLAETSRDAIRQRLAETMDPQLS